MVRTVLHYSVWCAAFSMQYFDVQHSWCSTLLYSTFCTTILFCTTFFSTPFHVQHLMYIILCTTNGLYTIFCTTLYAQHLSVNHFMYSILCPVFLCIMFCTAFPVYNICVEHFLYTIFGLPFSVQRFCIVFLYSILCTAFSMYTLFLYSVFCGVAGYRLHCIFTTAFSAQHVPAQHGLYNIVSTALSWNS